MSSSESTLAHVRLRLRGIPRDAYVTIYDAQDRPVWSAPSAYDLSVNLQQGLYNVRVERLGRFTEQLVRLVEAHDFWPTIPQRYTSAPLEGSALTHEYYSEPATRISRTVTRFPIGTAAATGGLFIFIRAIDQHSAKSVPLDVGSSLMLRDAKGRGVSGFQTDETQRDQQFGWMALSARATPGFYALHHMGTPPREAALYVFYGWQTQVFVLYHSTLRLETMRVFLSPIDRGFHWSDEEGSAVDLALDGFQSGVETLTDDELQGLLSGKFSNPMLGIVGAHVLLQRMTHQTKIEASKRMDARDKLTVVINNLENMLPGSPDIAALRLLAMPFLGRPEHSFSFRYPPMFRGGLTAVIDASAEAPELVPEDGLLDDIATRMLTDSPWSTWIPLGAIWPEQAIRWQVKAKKPKISPPPFSTRKGPEVFNVPGLGRPLGRSSEADERVELPSLDLESAELPMDRLAETATNVSAESDWIKVSLLDTVARIGYPSRPGSSEEVIDIGQIARQLGVTPRTVQRAAAALLRNQENALNRFIKNAVPSKSQSKESVSAMVGLLRKLEGPKK